MLGTIFRALTAPSREVAKSILILKLEGEREAANRKCRVLAETLAQTTAALESDRAAARVARERATELASSTEQRAKDASKAYEKLDEVRALLVPAESEKDLTTVELAKIRIGELVAKDALIAQLRHDIEHANRNGRSAFA